MFVVNNRKIFYLISAVLVGASIVALAIWGLNLSIDFKGGAIAEISYPDPDGKPTVAEIERVSLLKALTFDGTQKITEERFDSIGPLLGKEAVRKSLFSIILVIICIVLFVTFAFRKVSEPVASWKYGLITVLALVHDVLIPA